MTTIVSQCQCFIVIKKLSHTLSALHIFWLSFFQNNQQLMAYSPVPNIISLTLPNKALLCLDDHGVQTYVNPNSSLTEEHPEFRQAFFLYTGQKSVRTVVSAIISSLGEPAHHLYGPVSSYESVVIPEEIASSLGLLPSSAAVWHTFMILPNTECAFGINPSDDIGKCMCCDDYVRFPVSRYSVWNPASKHV